MAAYQQITHTAALLAIFLSLLATQAAEFGGGSVVHLTASDFDEKVLITTVIFTVNLVHKHLIMDLYPMGKTLIQLVY